ncbi:MAG: magnesium transporter [Elusimicrobia bacterium]|nr:magnesium transporter [Elusimicrobiota bacterium]
MKKNNIQPWALFFPELKELIEDKNFNELKKLLKGLHPVDLAEGWNKFSSQEKLVVFKLLEIKRAIEIFEELDFEEQTFILNNLEDTSISELLTDMASDEKAKLFKNLPDRIRKKMSALLKKEDAEVVRKIAEYSEQTAGRLMSTDFISLSPNLTAKQSLEKIQARARLHKIVTIYAIYVLDDKNSLIGGVTLRRLISAPQDIKISEIMSPVQLIKIKATVDQEDVAKLFSKYDLTCAPVVDDENHLIGVITIDDVVDVIHRLNTKEMYEIGKMSSAGGEIISYSRATSFELVKRRIGWLIALLIFDFLTGTVLKTFEHALSTVVTLTFFIPMLLDTGGNAGAQTSITIIRGLATGDVTFKNVFKIVKMEIIAAFIMALIVGMVAFGRAKLLQQDAILAIVVGSSMAFIVLLAIFTGIALPLVSKKIGLDPAVLAGPITTSVVDVVGLIIYFKIAQMLLPALHIIK